MPTRTIDVDDTTDALLERAAEHDGFSSVKKMLEANAKDVAERQNTREVEAIKGQLSTLGASDRAEVLTEINALIEQRQGGE